MYHPYGHKNIILLKQVWLYVTVTVKIPSAFLHPHGKLHSNIAKPLHSSTHETSILFLIWYFLTVHGICNKPAEGQAAQMYQDEVSSF